MKKILMIGIGWEQVPMVKKAKQMGLFVIVTTWWNKKKIPADKVFSIDSRDKCVVQISVGNSAK